MCDAVFMLPSTRRGRPGSHIYSLGRSPSPLLTFPMRRNWCYGKLDTGIHMFVRLRPVAVVQRQERGTLVMPKAGFGSKNRS